MSMDAVQLPAVWIKFYICASSEYTRWRAALCMYGGGWHVSGSEYVVVFGRESDKAMWWMHKIENVNSEYRTECTLPSNVWIYFPQCTTVGGQYARLVPGKGGRATLTLITSYTSPALPMIPPSIETVAGGKGTTPEHRFLEVMILSAKSGPVGVPRDCS